MKFSRLMFPMLALVLAVPSFRCVPDGTAHTNSGVPKTVKAASCNTPDVQRALNQASDEDTVSIPAGTCIWTTGVTYTVPGALTIMGAGSQTTLGGGDLTIIIDNIDRTRADSPGLKITTVQGKPFRLTGITFQGSGNIRARTYNGSVRIVGFSKQVRVDHVHFNFVDALALRFVGWIYGVVDHCLSDHKHNVIDITHEAWNKQSFGDGSWADLSHFGSDQFVFLEDNVFNGESGKSDTNGSYSNDCDTGGRFVIRHNTFKSAAVMNHEMAGRKRGCRAFEIYQNTFAAPPGAPLTYATFLRMGTGLIWGNSYTGYQQVVTAVTDRSEDPRANWGTVPTKWGHCGGSLGPSGWDGNTDQTGYPCLDQIGRGAGELLRNAFPIAVNSVSGTISWPHQAQEPVYVWNNSYNPPPNNSHNRIWGNQSIVTKENRDYYLQLPNYDEPSTKFDGSVGIGQGTVSARPLTCMPFAAYWSTDNNTLYQCSAKNTWTVYYTPFTYPHPLQGNSAPPVPPAKMRVTGIH